MLAKVRRFAEVLLDKDFDAACPASMDKLTTATGFQPACLMRLAAVAHVFGDRVAGWVGDRLPKGFRIAPITEPAGCHAGGLNFTRAFALYQVYRVTGETSYRDNYAELVRYHVGRPDLYTGSSYLGNPGYDCYAHWVAQMGVRAISLSYE